MSKLVRLDNFIINLSDLSYLVMHEFEHDNSDPSYLIFARLKEDSNIQVNNEIYLGSFESKEKANKRFNEILKYLND